MDQPALEACFSRVRAILAESRSRSLRAVNAVMISAYWEIGREIVEEEQRGAARAQYGTALIQGLSKQLSVEFGRGFSVSNLKLIRQFFLSYRDRIPPIRYALSSQSSQPLIGYSASSRLVQQPG